MVELHDEGDLGGILLRDNSHATKRRCKCVAAAINREFYDVLRIEILRVFRKAGACGVLNALVDGKNAEVAGSCQASVVVHVQQILYDLRWSIAHFKYFLHRLNARQMELLLRECF